MDREEKTAGQKGWGGEDRDRGWKGVLETNEAGQFILNFHDKGIKCKAHILVTSYCACLCACPYDIPEEFGGGKFSDLCPHNLMDE